MTDGQATQSLSDLADGGTLPEPVGTAVDEALASGGVVTQAPVAAEQEIADMLTEADVTTGYTLPQPTSSDMDWAALEKVRTANRMALAQKVAANLPFILRKAEVLALAAEAEVRSDDPKVAREFREQASWWLNLINL